MGFNPISLTYQNLVERVLRCFGPFEFSLAVTILWGRRLAGTWGRKINLDAYKCNGTVEQGLPEGGLLIYQSFSTSATVMPPRSTLRCYWWADDAGKTEKANVKGSWSESEDGDGDVEDFLARDIYE